MLAARMFPVTTWLRGRDSLEYIPEPDIFHDVFGQVPMHAQAKSRLILNHKRAALRNVVQQSLIGSWKLRPQFVRRARRQRSHPNFDRSPKFNAAGSSASTRMPRRDNASGTGSLSAEIYPTCKFAGTFTSKACTTHSAGEVHSNCGMETSGSTVLVNFSSPRCAKAEMVYSLPPVFPARKLLAAHIGRPHRKIPAALAHCWSIHLEPAGPTLIFSRLRGIRMHAQQNF